MKDQRPTLAVIGGTGDLGSGLSWRLARAGYPTLIGSRAASKAVEAAERLCRRGAVGVRGMSNEDAASTGQIVFMTVPFASHQATLESIRACVQGKIFVDCTVPLVPPRIMRVQLPAGGCAAVRAQHALGEGVRVVSAFQNVAAAHLQSDDARLDDCDILVTGNDAGARDAIVDLAAELGFRAWHAGAIDNSAVAEALTSVLIFLNKRYGIAGAGIRITGVPTKTG